MDFDPDLPYSLQNIEEIERRRALLTLRHVAPLFEHARGITSTMGLDYEIPFLDPCDGGIDAKALFLLEAPGPKAVGSAFISRNNPDPTARNICNLLSEAGIPRKATLLWNIVPWYVGTDSHIRAVKKSDIEAALPYLMKMLALLPELKAIVLVGRKAQSAKPRIEPLTNARLFECHHPSLLSLNRKPERRNEILDVLKNVQAFLKTVM